MEPLERKLYIGSSNAAGIAGLSRYTTPYQVALLKRGLWPEAEDTWPVQRGRAMEPLLLDWYEHKTHQRLLRQVRCIHPQYGPNNVPFIAGHADGLTAEPGQPGCVVVECKDVNSRMAQYWGEPGSDEIDPEYMPQVLHLMECAQAVATEVVVSFGGDEPVVFCVPRSVVTQARLMLVEIDFWLRFVHGDELPDPDGSEETRRYMAQLHRDGGKRNGKDAALWLEGTKEAELRFEQRLELDQELDGMQAQRDTLDAWFRMMIGDAGGMHGSWGQVTWLADKNGRRNLRFSERTRG